MSDHNVEPQGSKECPRCGETKPLYDFYPHASGPGGRNTFCILCQREYMKERRVQRLRGEAGSTRMAREILAEQGIPCVPGRAIGMPYTDLAAWGCVPLEAKGSVFTKSKNFNWQFEGHVREKGHDGIFVFIGWYEDKSLRVFVVPSSANWLFDEQGRPNRQRLAVRPESTWGNAHAWRALAPYENAYHWIERARIQYSVALSEGREGIWNGISAGQMSH